MTKIFINTSKEAVEISGETFIPGEWLHLDDSFVVDTVTYRFIKSPNAILAEKDAEIDKSKDKQEKKAKLKEQHLGQFAAGIKEAEKLYNLASDPIASQILTEVLE